MISEIPIGNLSGCSGIIVSGPVMIFLLLGISYLNASVANWFVNVRCSGMMKNAGGWSWKEFLGWIVLSDLLERELVEFYNFDIKAISQ
jgi:hypothetical protein